MKIFSSPPKQVVAPPAPIPAPDIQNAPVALEPSSTGAAHKIKVDAAYHFSELLVVAGWCTGDAELGLTANGRALDVRRVGVSREDVSTHFGIATGGTLGFVLLANVSGEATVSLTWEASPGDSTTVSRPLKLATEAPDTASELNVLGSAMGLVALTQPPHSRRWAELVARTPVTGQPCHTARGFLEAASTCDLTKETVVVGWVVQSPGTVVWLEDEAGRTFPLDGAFRRFRQDVHDAVGSNFGHASRDAGFIARVKGGKPGSVFRLKALDESGVHLMSETVCTVLPSDPVSAARWLFAIGTPLHEMHQRVPLIDMPLLGPLIEQRQAIWDELPVRVRQLGQAPASPRASVIVPLYGRSDFVEHQLIELCADPWFAQHAELIYVIDDPKLAETFPAQAEALHRLYRLPFCWMWGSVNRGFSGANNLGAQHARADTLLFLNSDAFPQGSEWLQPLVKVLAERPDIGAVAPRLVFADGSIQHAGMAFERREELGIWINHHPRMGLDPQLDPISELAAVPSVTGACIAIRRKEFDDIGGWDTGYLIGDFEDSDLCLKLRSRGLSVAYQPAVQLTHLERQSFKLLGQDEFRMRVVIYNAVRHQTRWHAVIDQPVHGDRPALLNAA